MQRRAEGPIVNNAVYVLDERVPQLKHVPNIGTVHAIESVCWE